MAQYKVLLIGGEPMVQSMLSLYLQRAGVEHVIAKNTEDASISAREAASRNEPFWLYIVDYNQDHIKWNSICSFIREIDKIETYSHMLSTVLTLFDSVDDSEVFPSDLRDHMPIWRKPECVYRFGERIAKFGRLVGMVLEHSRAQKQKELESRIGYVRGSNIVH